MVKGNVDDYIRSTGHLAFVNLFLKYALFVLGLVCVGLVVALVLISRHAGEVRAIPIVINEATGESRPIDWRVVDAAGEDRQPAEVHYFVKQLLRNIYTYTRYTASSNLAEAFHCCVPDATRQVKDAVNIEARQRDLQAGDQGVVEFQAINILQTSPNILVQCYFRSKTISPQGQTDSLRRVAALRLKTVPRTADTPSGLLLVEYSQSNFERED